METRGKKEKKSRFSSRKQEKESPSNPSRGEKKEKAPLSFWEKKGKSPLFSSPPPKGSTKIKKGRGSFSSPSGYRERSSLQ